MSECLGDQHSVERVTVMARQTSGTFGIGNADRQCLEALFGDAPCDISRYGFSLGQLTEPILCGDFPRRSGADDDLVSFVRDDLACG